MDENKSNLEEREIDLRVIFNILRKNIIPLIIVTVVAALGFFVYSKFFITKQYEASATLIVNNRQQDANTALNTSDLYTSQGLAEVYSIIVKSDTVLQPVIDDLKLSMTYDQLASSVNVSTINSTQLIRISMKHPDAAYAQKIIAAITEVAPKIIKEKVDAGSVNIISESRVSNNGNPVSPNSTRNALIGALIGFVLTLVFVFIQEFMNNTFKTEDDIAKTLNIPLLGIIPAVDEKEFNKNV